MNDYVVDYIGIIAEIMNKSRLAMKYLGGKMRDKTGHVDSTFN